MSEEFAATVTVKVRPEKLEVFKALSSEVMDAMSKEKEFKHTWVHTLVDDPYTFFAYEGWACSLDHFMRELMNKPYRRRFEAELESMTVGERKIQIFNYVASYPGRSASEKPAG